MNSKPVAIFYVHLHLKPNGEPFYVGKGCDGTVRRSHDFSRRNRYHKCIVNKYGKENIEVLVFPRDNESQAFEDEVKWIKCLRNQGYILANMTDGGEGASGLIQSDETRAKISKSHMGNQYAKGAKRSLETRRKMSNAQKKRPKRSGWNHSEETKKKMSASAKAVIRKPFSEQWHQKQKARWKK